MTTTKLPNSASRQLANMKLPEEPKEKSLLDAAKAVVEESPIETAVNALEFAGGGYVAMDSAQNFLSAYNGELSKAPHASAIRASNMGLYAALTVASGLISLHGALSIANRLAGEMKKD